MRMQALFLYSKPVHNDVYITKHKGDSRMNFAWALAELKLGFKVTRKHWKNNQFLWLTVRAEADWCQDPVLKKLAEQQDSVPAAPTISVADKDVDGTWIITAGWLPQQYDLFAEDWAPWDDMKNEQSELDKLPKAGSMENCEKLSKAINQLLESIGVMPHLTVTLVPGPEDKELLISIEERSDHGASNFPLYVADVDGIIKTNIGSPVKSIKTVTGGYEVEDMQINLGKED